MGRANLNFPIQKTASAFSLVRKGRVKALSFYGAFQGYLGKSGSERGVHDSLTMNPGDALLVSFNPPTDGLFAIRIDVGLIKRSWSSRGGSLKLSLPSNQDASKNTQDTDELAITWRGRTGGEWMTND